MNDIRITLQGNAADKPRLWTNGARPFARVNVAATPRLRQDGEWVDGETQWVQVKAWGKLAENMALSIRKGDPVMVVGTFRHEEYTNDEGVVYKTAAIHATGVGFDLRRACALVANTRQEDPSEQEFQEEDRSEENPWPAAVATGTDSLGATPDAPF